MNTDTPEKTPPTLSVDAALRVLGMKYQYELSDYFEIDASLISRWRAAGTVPAPYIYQIMHDVQPILPSLLERVQSDS